jgi:hypothetical protein
MKYTIFVPAVAGMALVLVTFTWAGGQSTFHEPNARNIALNIQPDSPESAKTDPLGPLAGPAGSGVSVSDTRGVREAIDKYKFLFEGRNADQLRKDIWPSMSAKQYHAIKGAFKVVSQVTVAEDCLGSPKITSDSAEWTCNETLGYYVTGKTRPAQTHPIQFRLKKQDGKWYVLQPGRQP